MARRAHNADLKPLVGLEAAWREGRLPAQARGLAFRLIESAGALDRGDAELVVLSPDVRKALAHFGVRIGRHSIFMPALIRPRAARTLALLAHVAQAGRPGGLFLPRPGALSAPCEEGVHWIACAAAGYRRCGRIAVRFDRVELLARAVREAAPAKSGAALTPAMAQLIGAPFRELEGVLAALSYRADGQGLWRPAAPVRPARTRPRDDGNPFAALPNLLSGELDRAKRRGNPA